ncbi:MAG: pyrroline-5-carboxylate reductase [Candidatus Korarchaeum sp.]|nr:pyrroline-5-carboxylate reductase [Candidatus Korarchaeum sp.]MDW8036090.1 pyrroline-5-carboxylate reductase [Candidatus Korarchaeum sp.]
MAPFLLKPDVAIIGLGKIGNSLALGLLKKDYHVLASASHPEKHRSVEAMGIELLPSYEAARRGDVVVIAVKPKQVRGLAEEIGEVVRGKLVISVAAALTTKFLEGLLPGARVIRAMPNLAIMVGESVTAITRGESATDRDVEIAEELFGAVGDCLVVEEGLMDMITGLSGSGPAYAFIFIDALADAGVKAGLPKDLALRLAAKSLLGASRMVLDIGEHPAVLKDMVITPGGVTIAAMHVLERYRIRAALMDAVGAAVRRAEEIREELLEGLTPLVGAQPCCTDPPARGSMD